MRKRKVMKKRLERPMGRTERRSSSIPSTNATTKTQGFLVRTKSNNNSIKVSGSWVMVASKRRVIIDNRIINNGIWDCFAPLAMTPL
jgi:hypothetical protein